MATKPFLLVMNIEYDPISPVNTPRVLTPGASTDPSIPKLQPATVAKYSNAVPAGTKDMDPSIIAAIIGGAVTIGSTIANAVQQKKLQKRQEEYQKEYFDYTFNKQTEEKWNEIYYNDPFQQMQRLRNAGLNENLMYGSLGNVAGAAGNAPANAPSGLSGSMPNVAPYFDSGSVIQALLSPLQAMSQISLNRSQAFKNFASAGVDKQQANRLSLLTPKELMQYDAMIENLDQATAKMFAEVEGMSIDNYVKDVTKSTLVSIQERTLARINAEIFGTYQKGYYDAAAAARMRKETNLVLPALARSYNASAAEKFAIAKQYTETLESVKRQFAAKADVSEDQAEYYFYTEVLPTYLDLGVDVSELLLTRGLKLPQGGKTKVTRHYNPDGSPKGFTSTSYE